MNELNEVLEKVKKTEVDLRIEIVNLQAEVANVKAELKECANELCMMCGSYKTEHEGTCSDCRYLPIRKG